MEYGVLLHPAVKLQLALNEVISETKLTPRPCKVSFSKGDFEKLSDVSELLEPVMEVTNHLQGDNVTSSLVIPLITYCYNDIQNATVVDEDAAQLQKALLFCFPERFKSNHLNTPDQSQNVRLRKITRDEIFQNKALILATLLDPRFKTLPFNSHAINSSSCSKSVAITALENEYCKQKGEFIEKPGTVPSSELFDKSTEPMPKTKTLFDQLVEAKSNNDCTIRKELLIMNKWLQV
ncbi:unnamed protein product [Allacma fusca]|uniref:Uncharacterized protein n=1 Tax=Allacma fusca TaxID=39272 RepID=A0A8J2KZD8_9HEXA|nr:unnamed protein product [Allacma fusca]